MKRRFFLTSLIVAGLIRPATAETFPADGYMLEDKTYENAATYTNTGVYEGEVNATAEYTDNVYNIAAGTYLPAGAEVAETCTAGNFCAGKANATYDESAPQGITACPTGYPNSAAGAGAQTQCYTACTLATANIAHATGVSGNDYYGDGADTCVATDCDPGYHVNSEVKLVDKTPIIPVDYTVYGDGDAYLDANGQGDADGEISELVGDTWYPTGETFGAGLTEPNTWAVHFEYGTVYGRASCQPNTNAAYEYVNTKGELVSAGEMTYEEFESGLAAIIGAAKAKYFTSVVRDLENGNVSEDEWVFAAVFATYLEHDSNYSTNSTGGNCYCQMNGFTPTGGNYENVAGQWLLMQPLGNSTEAEEMCAVSCAFFCSTFIVDPNFSFLRAALFEARGLEGGGTCAANQIKINWTDADEADIAANNAGMCTFGGDIKTPVKAAAKKGKTFKGWKFEKAN